MQYQVGKVFLEETGEGRKPIHEWFLRDGKPAYRTGDYDEGINRYFPDAKAMNARKYPILRVVPKLQSFY